MISFVVFISLCMTGSFSTDFYLDFKSWSCNQWIFPRSTQLNRHNIRGLFVSLVIILMRSFTTLRMGRRGVSLAHTLCVTGGFMCPHMFWVKVANEHQEMSQDPRRGGWWWSVRAWRLSFSGWRGGQTWQRLIWKWVRVFTGLKLCLVIYSKLHVTVLAKCCLCPVLLKIDLCLIQLRINWLSFIKGLFCVSYSPA